MPLATIASVQKSLQSLFGKRLIAGEPLSRHTTFGIGGPADLYIEACSADEVTFAVNECIAHGIEYFVLGGGSNILASDKGYRGVIIKCALEGITIEGNRVTVAAGHNLEKFVAHVARHGLAGVEMLAGIKGSVGGAVYGNAGAYGGAISDKLVTATILKPGGQPRNESKNYFDFSYRSSILKKTKEIVLEVVFDFDTADPQQLLETIEEIEADRAKKHPETDCSAGCFFKNIEKADEQYGKLPAGRLLDGIGAKMERIGSAGVFRNHANILVNLGDAKADDVRRLAMKLKEKVMKEYGYTLEEEITYLGDFS